jgi:hypothetical protein
MSRRFWFLLPDPGYLLAMKCLALRLGEEFQDLDDVKTLPGVPGLRTVADAEVIPDQYYAPERFPAQAVFRTAPQTKVCATPDQLPAVWGL